MSEIKLYNEDCLKVMGEVADNSVDLVCSDVPYLVTSRGNSGSMGGYVTNKLAMCGKYLKIIRLNHRIIFRIFIVF